MLSPVLVWPNENAGLGASTSLFSAGFPKAKIGLGSAAASGLPKEKPPEGAAVVMGAFSSSFAAPKRNPAVVVEVEDASFSSGFPKEKTGPDNAGSLLTDSPNFVAAGSKDGVEVVSSAPASFPKMGSEVEEAEVTEVEMAGAS